MRVATISGKVESLVVSKSRKNLLFTSSEKDSLGIGAVAAASIGESLSSTSLAGSGAGAEIEMEFFTCTVGDEAISGIFYNVEFKNGQIIDFVIDQWSDKNVLAARDPVRRIVWTQPYCTKGHAAQLRSNIVGSFMTSIAAAILLFVADYFSGSAERLSRLESAISQAFVSFILTLVLCFFVCKRVFRNSFNATLVFEALGFLEPAQVNLPKGNRNAERKYALETGAEEVQDMPWRFRYDKSAMKISG